MQAIPASFRDNSGYVFQHQNAFYRTVDLSYKTNYVLLMDSGLYDALIKKNLFIAHQEVNLEEILSYKVIKPIQLDFISYAYEWSFSMLQDAAICTLQNAIIGLQYGMMLKDANTHNIQFVNGKPVLIDSLSFEKYQDGNDWVAYRQFCESFLAPLVLMKYNYPDLNKLLIAYPNGIPLSVCKSLLPTKAFLNINVYLHIVLPAKLQAKDDGLKHRTKATKPTFSKTKLETLLKGLLQFVENLKLPKSKTTWDNYYSDTILSKEYLETKNQLVNSYLQSISFDSVTDLGANDGEFCLPLAMAHKRVKAVDIDSNCIEKLYTTIKQKGIPNIYPIINDLSMPSPALGWNHQERDALKTRLQSDVTLCLALIHHLAIACNIPITLILEYLHSLSDYVVIEFVDKKDPKVQQLLAHREDIFHNYNIEHFKKNANVYFDILIETTIKDTYRTLFLLKKKNVA